MRFDLKTACKNCPFRNDENRIVFSCRSRAEEIEEQAYRRGFPCHLSAEYVEDEDSYNGENGGYYAGDNTQHCAGYILMKLKEGLEESWPGLDNDEGLVDKMRERMDLNAPVFADTEDFLESQGRGFMGKPGKRS